MWIVSFILIEKKVVSADFLASLLAILEVFRRFVWNFFRLENEHLNNCGQFRAVRDISIAPIDSSDQTTILKMMDDPDGVINRWVEKQIWESKNNFYFHSYTKQNRPKVKKTKDIEKRQLIHPFRNSMQDLTIEVQGSKRLWRFSTRVWVQHKKFVFIFGIYFKVFLIRFNL